MQSKSRKEKTQEWIDSIETTKILHRLNKHTLGEDGVKMTRDQLRGAEMLLNRSMPVQRILEMTGHEGGPMQVTWLPPGVADNDTL